MAASALVVIDPEELEQRIARAVQRALDEREGRAAEDLRLLTAAEAGELLGVDGRTVLKWARVRNLPHRELGPRVVRFVRHEILAWRKAG